MEKKKGVSNKVKVNLLVCGPMILFYLFFVMILEPLLHVALRDPTQDYHNLWKENQTFDARLYLSNSHKLDFNDKKTFKLIHQETNLIYSTEAYEHGKAFTFNYSIPFSDRMRQNKTKPHFILLISPSRCHFQTDAGEICQNLLASYPIVRWEDKDHPYRFDQIHFDLVYDRQPRNLSESLRQYSWFYYRINPSQLTYFPPLTNDTFMEIPQNQVSIDMSIDRPSMNTSITLHIRSYFIWDLKLHADNSFGGFQLTQNMLNNVKHFVQISQPAVIYGYIIYFALNGIFKITCFIKEYNWWIEGNFDGKSLYTPILCLICHICAITNIILNQGSLLELVVRSIAALFALYKANSMFEPIMEFPYFAIHPTYRRTKRTDSISGIISLIILISIGCTASIFSLLSNQPDAIDVRVIVTNGLYAITAFECISLIPQIIVNFMAKSVACIPKSCVEARFGGAVMDDLFLLFTESNLFCFLNLIIPGLYLIECVLLPSKNALPLPKEPKEPNKSESQINEKGNKSVTEEGKNLDDVQKRLPKPGIDN